MIQVGSKEEVALVLALFVRSPPSEAPEQESSAWERSHRGERSRSR